MADALTLVIRGGVVVDGTGAAPFEADVGIAGVALSLNTGL
jgi:N-acyl-D-aspartate/D-glutamate deacylase